MKTKWWIVLLFVIILGFFISIAVQQLTTPSKLTHAEMTEQIERIYSANVQSLVEQNEQFIASFEKGQSIYEVRIDPVSKKFSDLKLIHKATVEVASNEQSSDDSITSPSNNEENEVDNQTTPLLKPLLTEQQAIQIAQQEVPGELDSAEFNRTSDGGYYFIEIEQSIQGIDTEEIIVQVHAITGKILSIKYDD